VSLRPLVVVLFLLLPVGAQAQLEPGRHSVIPFVGPTFGTQDLLYSVAPIAFGIQPLPDEVNDTAGPVETTIGLDPGFMVGVRYSYNLTRRLAVELEGSAGINIFVIQMLDLLQETGEPQYETTTTDARMWRYSANLTYHIGDWQWFHLLLTAGFGDQVMNLRQKGPLKTDPIRDRYFMGGFGGSFHAHELLDIRLEVRDFVYNFHFDNQFAGEDSWQIVSNRDVGRAVAASQPELQHDIGITLAFQVRVR
jgi:hypothetical protein